MIIPWSYWFTDGASGCVMAGNKTTAIMTILELNPSESVNNLSLHRAPEWTSNPPYESQAANICPTQRS
jgi:hypothetical protein